MAEDKNTKNMGTVLITLLAGAVLGAGIAFIVASQRQEPDSYEEADLFV